MILTEDEAKRKQCPEGIVRQPIDAHREFQYGVPNCIAAGCMAWRWCGYRAKSGDIYFDPQFNATGEPDAQHVGYCGKAGKP